MKPRPYQIQMAKEGLQVLKDNAIVYLSAQERVGKTLPAIMIVEAIAVTKVLVLTKKKALAGWNDTLSQYSHKKQYTVTNYGQFHHVKGRFDIVILDEAHNYISGFPDASNTNLAARKFTRNVPLIFISATPFAQGYQMLYNQLALSTWSPWYKWSTPMMWFNEFGIPSTVYTGAGPKPAYTETKPECFELVKHLFVGYTRKEVGFTHEPIDKVHYITLAPATKKVYNALVASRAIVLNGRELICDTISKLRFTLHMLEGGVFLISTVIKKIGGKKKVTRQYYQLGNTEKIDYIKQQWGDNEKLVIMYNYIAEKTKLESHFKHATILQATSYAEGIDLYEYDHLVIYSQDFSTARHTQRRARQANKLRDKEIIVHFLLVKKAISDQVYKAVSINKVNYVDSLYKKERL